MSKDEKWARRMELFKKRGLPDLKFWEDFVGTLMMLDDGFRNRVKNMIHLIELALDGQEEE